MKILVLNSGSSSQKACLYEIGETLPEHPPAALWEGSVEFGDATATIAVKSSNGVAQKEQIQACSREQVVRHLLSMLTDGKLGALGSVSEIGAVGHRVVHGGPDFEEPVIMTGEVRSAINRVSALAPLHIRAEVEGIEIVENIVGPVPRWPFSIPAFIGKCHQKPQPIQDPMGGSRPAFGAMDFTESIISTA
jgi:acetate kinase